MRGTVPAGISVEDLAVAILDEIEKPKLTRQHWTVAAAVSFVATSGEPPCIAGEAVEVLQLRQSLAVPKLNCE